MRIGPALSGTDKQRYQLHRYNLKWVDTSVCYNSLFLEDVHYKIECCMFLFLIALHHRKCQNTIRKAPSWSSQDNLPLYITLFLGCLQDIVQLRYMIAIFVVFPHHMLHYIFARNPIHPKNPDKLVCCTSLFVLQHQNIVQDHYMVLFFLHHHFHM